MQYIADIINISEFLWTVVRFTTLKGEISFVKRP
jgi:hypothetical protein